MSDWKDRLRAFDDLAPDDAVYARAAQGPRQDGPDGPSGRKRLVAGVVAFAVFGAAAVFGWQAFRGEPRIGIPVDPAGTALVVECGADTVSLSANVAVARRDGVPITVRDAGFSRLVLFSVPKLRPVSVPLTGDEAHLVLPLPPGKVSVECVPSEGPRRAGPTAGFQVDDPHGAFEDEEVSCASPVSVRISVPHTPTPDQAVEHAVRFSAGDSQSASGYPAPTSDWPARRIVVRDGKVVADLDVMPTEVSGMGCAGLGMYPLGTHTYMDADDYNAGSLDCPVGEQVRGGGNFTVRPSPGHPLATSAEAARQTFTGVSASDLTKTTSVGEGGEYVAVVRDGRIIARARLAGYTGGWTVYEVALCLNEGLGVRTGQ